MTVVSNSLSELGRISIALGTYNGADFLPEQLGSYLDQTLQPFELVVTDDGSTDATCEIIEAFARTAPFPVRLHRNPERLGFRDNFLRAASLCQGDYIAFSDQDDLWLPKKLETAMRRIVEDGTSLAIHVSHIGDEKLNITGRLGQGIGRDGVRESLSLLPLPGSSYGFTILFDRKLLDIVDPSLRPEQPLEPGLVVYHDLWSYILATVFGRISEINEPLSIYRQHSKMTSSGALKPYNEGRAVPLWHYEFRRKFAEDLAQCLESAEQTVDPRFRRQAGEGAKYYRRVAATYAARLKLYRHNGPIKRALFFAKLLLLEGVYAHPTRAGLGRKAMVKDLVLGAFSLGRPLEQG